MVMHGHGPIGSMFGIVVLPGTRPFSDSSRTPVHQETPAMVHASVIKLSCMDLKMCDGVLDYTVLCAYAVCWGEGNFQIFRGVFIVVSVLIARGSISSLVGVAKENDAA